MGRGDADMARPRILAPVGRPASRLVGGVRGDSSIRGGWCAFDTNPSHTRDDFTATLKAGGKGPKAPGGRCSREGWCAALRRRELCR